MKSPKFFNCFILCFLFCSILFFPVQSQIIKSFGQDYVADPVNVSEVDDFVVVDYGNGLVHKLRKESFGYNEIWLDDSIVVYNERWELSYQSGQKWKPRGTAQNLSFVQPQPYCVEVTRHYYDFVGTYWNMTYRFYGGFNAKITFSGDIGIADDYRISWIISGINKTFIDDQPSNHKTVFYDSGEPGITFDYSDVYENLGDITSIDIEQKANDHKLTQIFDVGYLPLGYFILDPTFGREDVGGSTFSCVNQFVGSYDAPGDGDGTADSITVYLTDTRTHASETLRGKCSLYLYSDDSFVGDTDENTGNLGTGWETFTFSAPKPSLTDATDYWIKVWANAGQSGDCRVSASNVGSNHLVIDAETYGYSADPSCPDPEVSTGGYGNWRTSIYCTYTADAGTTLNFFGDIEMNPGTNYFTTWEFSRWKDTAVSFGPDQQRAVTMGVYSETNLAITVNGWTQIYSKLLNFFGSANLEITVNGWAGFPSVVEYATRGEFLASGIVISLIFFPLLFILLVALRRR